MMQATCVLGLSLSLTPLAASAADYGRGGMEPKSARIEFGAYTKGMQQRPARLNKFEKKIGAHADIASYYYGFGDVFPAAAEARFADDGRRKVLVSWDMGPTRFTEWTHGEHDAYLDQIVDAALAYPHDVYVRPWPEMNGDWQAFQPTPLGDRPYGGTYSQFREAWRHVVTYARERGATNLRWVFNPTVDTYPETTPVAKIWPGDEYVDVLGLDGFNWGRDRKWGRWQSFREIFSKQYRRLIRLDATAPVWVCEFASKEPMRSDGAPRDRRHSKAAWLVDAFKTAKGMKRIRALIYFNERKERDWRVDSSRTALKAIRGLL